MRVRKEHEKTVREVVKKVHDALEAALTDAGVPLNDPVADMVLQKRKTEIEEMIDLMFWQLGR